MEDIDLDSLCKKKKQNDNNSRKSSNNYKKNNNYNKNSNNRSNNTNNNNNNRYQNNNYRGNNRRENDNNGKWEKNKKYSDNRSRSRSLEDSQDMHSNNKSYQKNKEGSLYSDKYNKKNSKNIQIMENEIKDDEEVQKLLEKLDSEVNILIGLKEVENEKFPRRQYRIREEKEKHTVRHYGQRKLFMSELYFLTQYGHLGKTVIYAGAAPGNHIPFLVDLFPNHNFILVDPNPFSIEETDRIKIINDYYTDDLCKKHQKMFNNQQQHSNTSKDDDDDNDNDDDEDQEDIKNIKKNQKNSENLQQQYQGEGVLFISDIRTADRKIMTGEEHENHIVMDNNLQQNWVSLLKPNKAMLKFRCPYSTYKPCSYAEIYDGEIYVQPWAPQSSTESRLITDADQPMIKYDNLIYEEKFFHHNDVIRKKYFENPIKGDGLFNDYDSCADILHIWYYLQKYKHKYQDTDFSLYKQICQFSYDLTQAIGTRKTLGYFNPPKEDRFQFKSRDHRVFYKEINKQNDNDDNRENQSNEEN